MTTGQDARTQNAEAPRSGKIPRALAGLIGLLCMIEIVAALVCYRETIDASDWASLEAALDPDLPVVLGTPWLGPSGRMHLPALADPSQVGAPDLMGLPAFQVVTAQGTPMEGNDLLEVLSQRGTTVGPAQTFGGLELHRVEIPTAGVVLDSLARAHGRRGLLMRSPGAKCQATGRERGQAALVDIRCSGEGRSFASMQSGLAEVDLKPRECLRLRVEEGVTAYLEVPRFEFGDQIVLHAGVHDFNVRLRGESPYALNLRRDDQLLGRWTVTDNEGWKRMRATTSPGDGRLILEVVGGVTGTWQDGKLNPHEHRELCLELRSLRAATSEPSTHNEAREGQP